MTELSHGHGRCLTTPSLSSNLTKYHHRLIPTRVAFRPNNKFSKTRWKLRAQPPRRSWFRRLFFDDIDDPELPTDSSDSFPDDDEDEEEESEELFEEPREPSWFRRFLLESLEVPGGGDDSFPDLDDEISDEVEFEERADGEEIEEEDSIDRLLNDDARFFRWKMKQDARNEVREFRDDQDWEDWLDDSWSDEMIAGEDGWYEASSNWEKDGVPREPPSKPERGMKRTIKELFFRSFEAQEEVLDDLQFEEQVFRYTSRTTAKFVGVLIIVPWITDFVIHDFVLAPFLDTYVEKVPLAAEVLDVRESQKLKIIEALKLERQRVRFEAEIGKAPPLSDDELSEHIREEALELREEYRLENRQAFASIWSDFAAGLTILLLLVFSPKQVSIMKLTGERLFTNISDTGKAFIIILLTDIFLGYHSESGWETVSEMVLEHYGFEVSQAAIYTFVAIVPVTIDACFKLWVFRFFRTLSPSASATFREMQRH